jgi:catechol 2,3-dioxygenase-like lactoylglutathione lyase family enzyme
MVSDLERSLTFYRDVLNFQVLMDRREFDLVPDSGPKMSLAVVEHTGDVKGMVELAQMINPGYTDKPASDPWAFELGFWAAVWEVTDIESIYQDWKQRGVEFVNEPNIQDMSGDIKLYSALMKDIDGNLIELVQPISFYD